MSPPAASGWPPPKAATRRAACQAATAGPVVHLPSPVVHHRGTCARSNGARSTERTENEPEKYAAQHKMTAQTRQTRPDLRMCRNGQRPIAGR